MDKSNDLAERVAILERKVEDLVARAGTNDSLPHWLDRVVGSFADEPEFDEIVRLGREFRESYDPDAPA